jgi:hypothetical protein
MRKCISFILLVIFLFNVGGYYLWFSVKQNNVQKEIRNEIRKGLKESELTLIIVNINNQEGICWVKAGKEFRYKGDFYDVVKKKIKNQKLCYYCINDKKEQILISNFNKSHNSKKETEKKLKRAFSTNNYFSTRYFLTNNLYSTDIKYPDLDYNNKSQIIKIPSPPPRKAS